MSNPLPITGGGPGNLILAVIGAGLVVGGKILDAFGRRPDPTS